MIQQKLEPPVTASLEPPKPPGTSIRCLEDPTLTVPETGGRPSLTASHTSEVVEEARDRFDRYWSKPETTLQVASASTAEPPNK